MEVAFSDSFKKTFKKRIKSTVAEAEFWLRLELFIDNPYESKLKTHKLSGKLKGLYSFSVHSSLRVVFYFTKDNPVKAIFVDIGTHDEVY
jgi:mRNA-degrading endonuclease YafQ of YafQ-DinJ toxin-antitoxin module